MSEIDIASVLAASGLVSRPDGNDLAKVMETVERQSWTCWVEPLASAVDERERWRAVVFEPGDEEVSRHTGGYRGRGATQAAVLALALARMLRRQGT